LSSTDICQVVERHGKTFRLNCPVAQCLAHERQDPAVQLFRFSQGGCQVNRLFLNQVFELITVFAQFLLGSHAFGKFALGSGTSQAVPQVAGLAALMWEANPHLTAKDIAQIIKKTSIRMGSPSPVTIRVPDAQAAMNAALAAK
jgi:hypothetical protein